MIVGCGGVRHVWFSEAEDIPADLLGWGSLGGVLGFENMVNVYTELTEQVDLERQIYFRIFQSDRVHDLRALLEAQWGEGLPTLIYQPDGALGVAARADVLRAIELVAEQYDPNMSKFEPIDAQARPSEYNFGETSDTQ